jgi:hypothetical protein
LSIVLPKKDATRFAVRYIFDPRTKRSYAALWRLIEIVRLKSKCCSERKKRKK